MANPAPGPASPRTPGLRAKVAFLSAPGSYPEKPAAVEVVQTHMSCVFLTDRHAYKLKKPVRYDFLDFSTLEARRVDCEEELRLNRRLARDVYLDIVPLVSAQSGELALAGEGAVVDWLVRMRRLPAPLMLDRAIRDGTVTREDVRRFTRVLAGFYRAAPPIVLDAREYRDRFERGIAASRRELSDARYGLAAERIRSATGGLQAALGREASALEHRVAERRIVDGHGDLRPEHICLGLEPLFIDCLEFNAQWRQLDPADELSYLAMECECAGAAWIGEVLFETYRYEAGDDPPPALVSFYKAYRAVVRATLCAWHLNDHPDPADQGKWTARAERYLELAGRHLAATPTGASGGVR